MRNIRTVHCSQPILRLKLLKLLDVGHILNENNNSCQTLVAQFLDALLVNLIILIVLKGRRCAEVINRDLQNLGISQQGFILQFLQLTILLFIYDFWRDVIVKTHLIFFLTVERKICGNLKNTLQTKASIIQQLEVLILNPFDE